MSYNPVHKVGERELASRHRRLLDSSRTPWSVVVTAV